MTGQFSHKSVLLNECMDALRPRDGGVYLDATIGGAGHSSRLLDIAPGARLYGIDRDADALEAAEKRLNAEHPGAEYHLLRGNFHDAKELVSEPLDGILADLGVSSYQLDEASRGFSYHGDAPLDMRMDQSQALTAEIIVNEWPQEEIARILRDYGEENWAAQIARVLCDRRQKRRVQTADQLVEIIDASIPKKFRAKDDSHPARRTFQALRIAVNDELAPLEKALRDMVDMLRPGGRLAVISFHSLEDRIVKTTFRSLENPCTCPKDFPVCVCGKKPVVRLTPRGGVTASREELAQNPRSRSATLRVAEKREDA